MKLTLDQAALAEALTWVTSVVPKRPANPAVSGVRLTLEAGTLTLTATDYDTTHTARLSVMPGVDGDVLVPAFLTRDLINAVSGQVTLDEDEGKLIIEAGRGTYRINRQILDDFPTPPVLGEDGTDVVSVVDSGELSAAVATSAHLVDDAAGGLVQGLHLESEDDDLLLIGARSSALGIARICGGAGVEDIDVQVPGDVFGRAVRGMSGQVSILARDGLVGLRDETRSVVTRTFVGEFVQWRRLLRDEHEVTLSVVTEDLLGAVRRAGVLTGGGAVALEVAGEGVRVTSTSVEAGGGDEEIDGTADGRTTCGLSVDLLSAALADLIGRGTDKAQVGLKGAQAVFLTDDLSGGQVTHIIAPRRL